MKEEEAPPPDKCPGYGTKLFNDEAPVLQFLGNVEYPFIAITPTLIWSSSTCWGPIYGSNRNILSFTLLETI